LRVAIIVISTAVAAMVGGRLFHVFWERPRYFALHPELIFTRWDGMTFYGAFFLGALVFVILGRILVRDQAARDRLSDYTAVALSIDYGLLRIGCFGAGCCWGRPSSLPWAVSYLDVHSAMPNLGIPVHPVQLYDASLGFLTALVLIWAGHRYPKLEGKWLALFSALYAAGRFLTEPFRGDAFRGEGLFLGLSTSQLISVALLLGAGTYLACFLRKRSAS
jgi:phosphatidylglycerol:prolipoprotein diacylglycerol transferase